MVFQMVQSQHIMSFAGPVALDLNPVFKVMELYGVEDQKRCLELVLLAYSTVQEQRRLNTQ